MQKVIRGHSNTLKTLLWSRPDKLYWLCVVFNVFFILRILMDTLAKWTNPTQFNVIYDNGATDFILMKLDPDENKFIIINKQYCNTDLNIINHESVNTQKINHR